jgi:AhpD family alkylhydroperoxidase
MDINEFQRFRERMNRTILEEGPLEVKRFFNLDSAAYQDGALTAKTKELLGLVASLVLRCNDCVLYHLIQCKKAGVNNAEMWEAWNVALVVGGSIIIPHLRQAVDQWKKLDREPAPD